MRKGGSGAPALKITISRRTIGFAIFFSAVLYFVLTVHVRLVSTLAGTAYGGPASSDAGLYSSWERDTNEEEEEEADSTAAEAPANRSTPYSSGVRPQIERDLKPWRAKGISMKDLLATRARAVPFTAALPSHGSGMVTTVIMNCVPYFLESETDGLASEYGIGSRGKLREFHEMLHSMCKSGAFKLPNVYFIWNVHPWPLLSVHAPVIAAAAAGTGSTKAHHSRELDGSRDTVPAMYAGASAAGTGGWGPEWEKVADAAASRPAPEGTAPVLSLCKTTSDYDVLYPNMYFHSPGFWKRALNSIAKASRVVPWEKRKTAVWWRGNSGWTWPASAPRAMVVSRYFRRRWADFAFTSHFVPVLSAWAGSPWLKAHLLGRDARAIRNGAGTRTPMEAVTRYKYALHLPGSYAATYSRTLQFLLWTGTAVFLYDCPYYEFYYPGLSPWVNYIPVNLTNLEERWAWAQAHPARVARIAAAGMAHAQSELSTARVFGYWRSLLEAYAALQTFTVKLPHDACTCWSLKHKKRPGHIPRTARRCPKSICDFDPHAR